jgi:glycosyltransferase involved in cell wall biosynthesis
MTKFTIIVPTRERSMPLDYCLKNLLKQDHSNFEILVSDNNSQDETASIVSAFNDSRIRYINTGKRISMSHNWEFALSHVESGWVLFIGDDDGLLPNALSVIEMVIAATGCEALTTTSTTFWWPNHFEFKFNGEITIPMPEAKLFEVKSSAKILELVMKGVAPYRELPWLYNGGASSVNLLNRLRRSDGNFFCSFNPDLYSAIALALGTTTYAHINIPISINGASKFSNGTSNMLGQIDRPNSPASKMMQEENIPFHSVLKHGKSFQMLVYEAYLQAAHLYTIPKYNLVDQVNVALKVAPPLDFIDVLNDCKAVAQKNNIVMPALGVVKISRTIYKLSEFYRHLRRRRNIVLAAESLGAHNVDLASDAIKYIYSMLDTIYHQSFFNKIILQVFVFSISSSRYFLRIVAKYR